MTSMNVQVNRVKMAEAARITSMATTAPASQDMVVQIVKVSGLKFAPPGP